MLVASKRDMVLLTADTRLDSDNASSPEKVRLVSASCSVEDPSLPPRKGYSRFPLNIGGFLVEDLGSSGLPGDDDVSQAAIRVTQVSDLGEMAAWVPASVIRMVAGSMVPRSVAAIARIAGKLEIPAVLRQAPTQIGEEEPAKRIEKTDMLEVVELQYGYWQQNRCIPALVTPDTLGMLSASTVRRRSGRRVSTTSSKQSHHVAAVQPSASSVSSLESAPSHSDPPYGLTLQRLSTRLPGSSAPSPNGRSAHNARNGSQGYPFPTDRGEAEEESTMDSDSVGISSGRSRLSIAVGSGSETIPGTPDHDDSEREDEETESSDEDGGAEKCESEIGGDRDATCTVRQVLDPDEQHATQARPNLLGSSRDSMHVSLEDGAHRLHRRLAHLSKVFHEQGRSASSAGSDGPEKEAADLTALIAEALQADLGGEKVAKGFQDGAKRKSKAQREASRISALLLSGSDAVAMAIAPAARQSCASVRSPHKSAYPSEVIVEEPSDAPITGLDATVKGSEEPSRRTRFHSLHRSASGASASLAPPATSQEFANGLRQRAKDAASRSPSFASSLSSSDALRRKALSSDISSIASTGSNEIAASGWTSGLKDVPYALALGIISLAWAGKQSIDGHVEDVADQGSHEDILGDPAGSSFVMPSASALDSARKLLQRTTNPLVIKASPAPTRQTQKPRPSSHYDPQDSKLHPFPASLGKAGGHNLPPLGIAANKPVLMECAPAKSHNGDENMGSSHHPSIKSSWWFG